MLGVNVRQVRQAQPRFVKKDEWVDLFVRHRPGGKCLQDRHAHHTDPRRVLYEDGLSSRRLNLCGHVSLLSFLSVLSLTALGGESNFFFKFFKRCFGLLHDFELNSGVAR
jgi:hypothetical protein